MSYYSLLSSSLLVVVIILIVITTITTLISATTEPTPFEADFDEHDDQDDHYDSETQESYSAFTPGDSLEEAGRTIDDIIRKNLGKVLHKHTHAFEKSHDGELHDNLPKGGQRMNAKQKHSTHDIKRRKRVQSNHLCPDESAPKLGDRIFLHIPSRDHLMPRFTGMRVFAPPHANYHSDRENGGFRDNQHVHDHHFASKILYVFDEHVIQGVWPVHDYVHQDHRDLHVVVKDIHVQADPSGNHEQLCYLKVVPDR